MIALSADEIIVDSFAGGGGASLGIEMALGRSPDIAINHDADAIAIHAVNHPTSKHYRENVWAVDPVAVCAGRPVGLMWLSPDCKHFSKAKGGKPVSKKIRGLAWVARRWAKAVRPRVIILENVEEFQSWGPLMRVGNEWKPDPTRKGETFQLFVTRLRRLGYEVQWRELRARDYGAPTIRKRLFLVARCDGAPIVWPAPTHGKHRAHPWRTTAECIDWTVPCPSIFERQKPLAENTLKRIARGIRRYVIESPRPFIVPMQHENRPTSIDDPLQTITTQGNKFNLVAPTLIQTGYGEDKHRNGGAGQPPRSLDLHQPLGTVVGGGVKHALIAAFMAKHYGGHETDGQQLGIPLSTITTQDHHHLVSVSAIPSFAEWYADTKDLGGTYEEYCRLYLDTPPRPNHISDVRAFLIAYYGTEQASGDLFMPMPTVTTKDRLGLVVVDGSEYVIADIGMRMLVPRELARAQGFRDSYVIEWGIDPFTGARITMSNTAQVKMIGNSVCPDIAAALVAANVGTAERVEAVAA